VSEKVIAGEFHMHCAANIFLELHNADTIELPRRMFNLDRDQTASKNRIKAKSGRQKYIICLVMVPLVLTITRRMRVPPLPFLIAVATASNIGSVATITGNPQNMLIGSFSGISYLDFLIRLGPVAAVTGSVANIIVVERARPEVNIGFHEYFRAGLPVTLATLFFGWFWLTWVG
jgi:Na+/H+ antiporter NhaD/arsenite permease-like protein